MLKQKSTEDEGATKMVGKRNIEKHRPRERNFQRQVRAAVA